MRAPEAAAGHWKWQVSLFPGTHSACSNLPVSILFPGVRWRITHSYFSCKPVIIAALELFRHPRTMSLRDREEKQSPQEREHAFCKSPSAFRSFVMDHNQVRWHPLGQTGWESGSSFLTSVPGRGFICRRERQGKGCWWGIWKRLLCSENGLVEGQKWINSPL